MFVNQREGVVFKSMDGKVSFKAISNKWLEKNYDYLRSELLDHFVNFNTTSKLAKYFLKDIDYTKNGYKPSE
jgi:hypothetical protein